MAIIATTDMTGTGSRTVTITTLGASDTFVYNEEKNPILYLNNITVGSLTPIITGSLSTTFPCPGVGDVSVTPFTFPAIGAGVTESIPLKTIKEFLKGTITLTVADGIEATLLEF